MAGQRDEAALPLRPTPSSAEGGPPEPAHSGCAWTGGAHGEAGRDPDHWSLGGRRA